MKRLWSHVHSYTNAAKAEVRCFDEITRTFETLDGLLHYENNPRAFIKQIEISGHFPEKNRSISITLGRSYSAPISLSIRGEEMDVSIVQDKVRDTIHGMKAWYSRVATLDMAVLWIVIMMLFFLILQLMGPSNTAPTPGRSFKEALHALPYVLLILGGVAGAVWFTVFVRRRFFPMVSFALGQGAKRYQLDEQIRWTVIIGFLVGIAGSIAFASIGG